MFFWFIGTAVLTVGIVFRDPRFDYRLLIVGSILPIGDARFGGAAAMHSITLSITLLALLMLVTAGRKPIRRTLLGLPIGMFLHLVFDAAWNDTDIFWWPFTGAELGATPLPVVERGGWSVALEVVGVVLCVWLWRRNQLGDPERRREFARHGRLVAVPDRFG